ncbi:MAG: hypothetical protein AAFR65_11520 [Pseudomonadota bacterium]
MNIKLALIAGGAAALAACATSTDTIEKRLVNLGLDEGRAGCMAEDLDNRLNDKQLSEFAGFTTNLDRAETPVQAIASLKSIDDPLIARAVVASSVACAFG